MITQRRKRTETYIRVAVYCYLTLNDSCWDIQVFFGQKNLRCSFIQKQGKSRSICTLAANDFSKKRTGFILMMVATALWCPVGIGLFYAVCYYCVKRCPSRIRIERVEKWLPLSSSADDL